jgi:trans-aconitate methyltransferase
MARGNASTKSAQGPVAILEPIAAYNLIASTYAQIAQRRQRYLDAIDGLIVERVPREVRSLLDVGAGDGRRTSKIANRVGAKRVVLLEPSAGIVWRGRSIRAPQRQHWGRQTEEAHQSKPARRIEQMLPAWCPLAR